MRRRYFYLWSLFSFLLYVQLGLSSENTSAEVQLTYHGDKFTRVQTHFIQGWKDEKGVIWQDDAILVQSQEEGAIQCSRLNGRLPSNDEVDGLLQTMLKRKRTITSGSHYYEPQILPNLMKNIPRLFPKSRSYWTSTSYQDHSDVYYVVSVTTVKGLILGPAMGWKIESRDFRAQQTFAWCVHDDNEN